MTTDARVLRADRFAEIGALLQRDATVLIEQWAERAAIDQPQAARVHHHVLLDHLPTFMVELGRALADSEDPFHSPHFSIAAQHGEQRWEVGWSLSEIIRDYQILRLVILDYLDDALDRPLRMREIQAIGLALDEAIEASVLRYTQFCDALAKQKGDALQAADRRKNEFLATLSHELRNPLAPLRNSIDVLRLNRADPAVVDQVREIMERQVRQMTRLVDDLLDMSRIALGKLELRRTRLDLRQVLSQVVPMNAPLSQARRQNVTTDFGAEPLWVDGDQSRLVQIFVNLLNNAVKYTPDGGRIRLHAFRNYEEVVVRVQDNGVGIPADMLSQIFDLFTQIDLGVERMQGGLGIGLSLVRQLVDLHGGKIAVKSGGLNQGSEFTVTLPYVPVAQAEGELPPESTQHTVGRRVLLVEDNPDARHSLALLLELVGHEVVAVENAEQAIEAVSRACPDVALIDIGLPGLDGYQLAARLRAIVTSSTVLVAVTGFSRPEDRQRAIEAGFHTHLTKPVELQTIQALLDSYCQARSAPRDE